MYQLYVHLGSSVNVAPGAGGGGGGGGVPPVAAAHVFGHPTAAVFWPLLHVAV
jgi:hypothetical protein